MIEKEKEMAGLWSPPKSGSELKPASNRWSEAIEQIATEEFKVAYAGGIVKIEKGSKFYIDDQGRILIGWHGTYNPPCDMGGNSILKKD